ncbi:MAG: PilT/PilU family type 4a pilus ATPase [Kofleriaceae bacterium]
MSTIASLLRVMTLRDADAITLEAGRVPSLRGRRGVEALAMPSLEAELLEDFVRPLLGARSLDEGPLMVAFTDADDGATYPVTIERGAQGLRIVARRGGKQAAKPTPVASPAAPVAVAPRPLAIVPADEPVRAPSVASIASTSEPACELLAQLLGQPVAIARAHGASDVFLSTGQRPRMKLDGRLDTFEHDVDDAQLAACVRGLGANVDLSLELATQDGGVRVRVNAFEHLNGAAIAARLINDRVPGLAELALPPELASIVDLRDGLVLVCGPTGSGKSTTLASLIDLLDQKRAAHVITLEDPIEYRFAARRCLIHQRELGTHISSFAEGLRAALREAPDVILLGELRDRETLAAALTAAETGHLVLATLHAPSAIGAIDRVIDAFPEGQQRQIRTQLAGALRVVVTQFLLPKRDGGRAPALEVVPVTAAVANIIRKGDLHMLPSAIQSGRDAGMVPLERSLARLLEGGTVAPQAVKRIAADHDLLSALSSKLR